MNDDVYTAVDDYLDGLFGGDDDVLRTALQRSADRGLPAIQVSPHLGRFLHVLALTRGARSILEIGTLGGYSTIWLARALPDDGRLVTLEVNAGYAALARQNLADAGFGDRVDVRVGQAIDLLAALEQESARFDMVFIDADKPPYAEYYEAALRVSHPGTLIVADNIVRGGKVLDASDDPAATGARRFNATLAADPRVAASVIQQVGVKGHDGMALAVVL